MAIEKMAVEKSVQKLLNAAEDCLILAKSQQAIAETQHNNAASQHAIANKLEASVDKLEEIGHSLEDDAIKLKGETDVVTRGVAPSRPGQ